MSLIDDKPETLKAPYLKLTENLGAEKQGPGDKNSELNKIQMELARLTKENLFYEICQIAKWDKHATLTYREPWFACRISLLEKLPTDLKADVSHEAQV
jgi:hypothetical protein